MAAPKGNKYGLKLQNPLDRAEAYRQYCDWVAQGECKEAWTFEHPTLSCTHRTMERYMRECPEEFPSLHMDVAKAKSYRVWTERGLKMMIGQIEKCQPAIFQMYMRNKFGWDKENNISKETQEPLVKKLASLWRGEKNEVDA